MTYTYDAENNRIAMESERHKETHVVDTVSSSLSRILTITGGSGTNTRYIYGQSRICEKRVTFINTTLIIISEAP